MYIYSLAHTDIYIYTYIGEERGKQGFGRGFTLERCNIFKCVRVVGKQQKKRRGGKQGLKGREGGGLTPLCAGWKVYKKCRWSCGRAVCRYMYI